MAETVETPRKESWRVEAGRKGQAVRKANIEQWQARNKVRMTSEEHRQRIKVGMLITKLEKVASGQMKLSQSQVTAAKALLDKALPTLQAVEAHVITEPAATRSEADLLADLRALVRAYPDVVRSMLAEIDAIPGECAVVQSNNQANALELDQI